MTTINEIKMFRKQGYGVYTILVDWTNDNAECFSRKFNSSNSKLWDKDEQTEEELLIEIGGLESLKDYE